MREKKEYWGKLWIVGILPQIECHLQTQTRCETASEQQNESYDYSCIPFVSCPSTSHDILVLTNLPGCGKWNSQEIAKRLIFNRKGCLTKSFSDFNHHKEQYEPRYYVSWNYTLIFSVCKRIRIVRRSIVFLIINNCFKTDLNYLTTNSWVCSSFVECPAPD